MPPKRSRTTRATRGNEQNHDAATTKEDTIDTSTTVEETVDGVNNSEVNAEAAPPLSSSEPKENGTDVNGKLSQKSAAQKKREKRKQRKREGSVISDTESIASSVTYVPPTRESSVSILDTIDTDIDPDDPQFLSLRKVFHHFEANEEGEETLGKEAPGKGEIYYSDDDDVPMAEDEDSKLDGISRKRARRLNRPSVAQLKQVVDKPEIVEWTDVAAQDPQLLIHLRGYRNMIPVPSHWGQKRDYLASKRGVAKQPYELPSFIRDTGIQEMRNPHDAQTQSLRQKMRERVQGKLGKLDVDYQKLHDAFFRYQTKPPLTVYGEVYYEGKEFETNFKHKRPGEISTELKEALNIPPGAPPPWLINMQRYGPPPSFPNLKIPGLNAPIPPGAKWGFHPGGWGKPPVDEFNKPLYGDVFGVMEKTAPPAEQAPVERELWGTIEEAEVEADEVEESEEEEEEEAGEEMDMDEVPTADEMDIPGGLETPSGLTSTVPSGLETPDFLELRKSRFDVAPEPQTQEQRDLYRVLPNTQRKKGFLGDQGYDISAPTLDDDTAVSKSGIDVALDPEQLENLTKAELRALHDKEAAKQTAAKMNYRQQEDMSDMVAEHTELQAKKRKTQEEKKKSKFKF